MNYQETLQYLYTRLAAFHLQGGTAYKPGLTNTLRLMEVLDNPHTKFPSIHIAGTNGKGSVSHYLSAILQEAGYKVGLYTSPHLVDFGERIRVNGKMIDEQYVIDFVANNQEIIQAVQPSFFELTMAMAFSYFAENQVDIAIIEVGLGGRLDSTNIIHPIVSIINNIAFDHQAFLGNTLAAIALEKAGIMKKDVPIVIGEALAETKEVFVRQAETVQTTIYFAEEQPDYPTFVRFALGKMCFSFHEKTYQSELLGTYQLKNLATVFLATQIINQNTDFQITEAALSSGIANVVSLTGLRGRWELLQKHPTIIADTAHNPAGMQVALNQLKNYSFTSLRIIIGMVDDKDIDSILQMLPREANYYFTQAPTERAIPASVLQEKAEAYGLRGQSFPSIEQAMQTAQQEAVQEDLIFITGSNFVVGEALYGP